MMMQNRLAGNQPMAMNNTQPQMLPGGTQQVKQQIQSQDVMPPSYNPRAQSDDANAIVNRQAPGAGFANIMMNALQNQGAQQQPGGTVQGMFGEMANPGTGYRQELLDNQEIIGTQALIDTGFGDGSMFTDGTRQNIRTADGQVIPVAQYQQGQLPQNQAPPMAQSGMAPQQPAGGSQNFGLQGFENALGNGLAQSMDLLQQGNAGAFGALQGTRQDVLNQQNQGQQFLNNSFGQANQAAQQGNMSGQNTLFNALGGAQNQLGMANNTLNFRGNQSQNTLAQNFGQARGDLSGFAAGGSQAAQQQAALSGAYGAEAQQMAMNDTLNSPEFDFLREQGNRAVMANAAATGGVGGGEVMRDLQRFGQGLASQQFGQAFDRLSGVANRGQQAAGQMANLGAQQGQTSANLFSQLGGQQANIFGQGAQNIMGTGQASAGMDQATANLQANLAQNQGNQQANLAQNTMGQLTSLGGQASNLLQRGGEVGSNTMMNAANNLAQGRNQAGRDLANALAGQSGAQANLVNQQGQQVAGQVDNITNNLANLLQMSGSQSAADQVRMAELLQALAVQNSAQGTAAIGQGGAAQANAALARAGATNDLLGQLTGAFALGQ